MTTETQRQLRCRLTSITHKAQSDTHNCRADNRFKHLQQKVAHTRASLAFITNRGPHRPLLVPASSGQLRLDDTERQQWDASSIVQATLRIHLPLMLHTQHTHAWSHTTD